MVQVAEGHFQTPDLLAQFTVGHQQHAILGLEFFDEVECCRLSFEFAHPGLLGTVTISLKAGSQFLVRDLFNIITKASTSTGDRRTYFRDITCSVCVSCTFLVLDFCLHWERRYLNFTILRSSRLCRFEVFEVGFDAIDRDQT